MVVNEEKGAERKKEKIERNRKKEKERAILLSCRLLHCIKALLFLPKEGG